MRSFSGSRLKILLSCIVCLSFELRALVGIGFYRPSFRLKGLFQEEQQVGKPPYTPGKIIKKIINAMMIIIRKDPAIHFRFILTIFGVLGFARVDNNNETVLSTTLIGMIIAPAIMKHIPITPTPNMSTPAIFSAIAAEKEPIRAMAEPARKKSLESLASFSYTGLGDVESEP